MWKYAGDGCGVAIAGNPDIKASASKEMTTVNRSVSPAVRKSPDVSSIQQKPKKNNIKFTVTISADTSLATEGMQKYL